MQALKKTIPSWALCLSLFFPVCISAMTLERVNKDLYATGPTFEQDFLSFKEALAKGDIQRLILVNGPGGDLWTGMQVARMVQSAKIKTVVSGYCMSACSLIFMAGQARAFGTGHLPRMTMIGIHGAHSKNTQQVAHQAMPQMYAFYKQQMGDQFDAAVINQALYDIQDAAGFLRIRELQRTQEKDRTPWFCATGQTPFEKCQQHTGKNALSLGVVTQAETEELNLPNSMQSRIGFFGQTLHTPMQDLQERAGKQLKEACAGLMPCQANAQKTLTSYLSAQQHKAMAIGWGKTGFGARWAVDEAGLAQLAALYTCNHAKNNPKLCRLAYVNEHELLPIYEEIQAQVEPLLKTLKAPSPEAMRQEREEPGASTPSQLRVGQHITGMTPKSLEGIQRWDTATLVQALQQAERPTLIDTAFSGPMIPGALNFINSGLAFEDSQKEAEYAERFRHMLRAAVADLDKPLVFYCASASCWLSVNAAMRARQMGYTRVIWYRGGQTAWMQAGLPTVNRAPVAVLN